MIGKDNNGSFVMNAEKRKNVQKRRRRRSLKKTIVIAIIVCWIIPSLIIVTIMSGRSISSRIERINETVNTSAENAFSLFCAQIEAAVDSSRGVSYVPDVSDAYEAYLADGDSNELYTKMMSFLKQRYRTDTHFYNAILLFYDKPNQLYYNYTRSSYSNIRHFKYVALDKTLELAESLGNRIAFMEDDGHIYLIRNLMQDFDYPYGVLVLELDMETIIASMKGITWNVNYAVRLGEVTVGEDEQTIARLPKKPGGGKKYTYDLDTNAYVTGVIRQDGCIIGYAAEIDASSMLVSTSWSLITFMIVALLLIPMLAFLFLIMQRYINEPIKNMVNAYHKIENGELGCQIPEQKNVDEMNYLFHSFNSMSGRLLDQFEQLYREELALRDAKIMALQSQINPHFLNNTLEIINWEARFAGNVKVSKMIESLSIMLEAALDREKRPLIHLSEELVYIDAYLYIASERFGKRLVVEKDIDPLLLDVYVPRLVMQPIIENAIEHGVQPRQNGTVSIRVYRSGKYILISVINDGELSESDKEKIHLLLTAETKPGEERAINLGIRNVNERIRILYGKDCGLTLRATEDKRTESVLRLRDITLQEVTAQINAIKNKILH